MKVAQFINTIDDGGAETLILSLTQQLLRNGINAEIHAFEDSWIIERCRTLDIPHVPLDDKFKRVHQIKKLPLFGIKYGMLLHERGITVLHSHVYGATLRGAAATSIANIIHVATQHDNHSVGDKTSRARWLNIAGRFGTRLVMISNQMMDYYVDHGVKQEYCSFVYNGVEGERFKFNPEKAIEMRKRLRVLDDEIMFVAPARLQPVKGFDVLIKAFIRLYDEKFKLFILGTGPLRDELEQMVQCGGISKKVQFAGAVNNVEDYMSAADAFTLGSRNEGLPCSIIEAMFASLPIVTTNVGGNSELVLNEQNGYLSPFEDDEALAANLLKMINSGKGAIKAMGAVSYNHAQNFTLESMTNNYVNLYYKRT